MRYKFYGVNFVCGLSTSEPNKTEILPTNGFSGYRIGWQRSIEERKQEHIKYIVIGIDDIIIKETSEAVISNNKKAIRF